MSKDLESKTGLKMAVISAGTQLVLLGESGGGSAQEPEDSDSDPASIQSRLRQTELDWSSLLLELPGVQQELHKVRRVLQRVCVCTNTSSAY